MRGILRPGHVPAMAYETALWRISYGYAISYCVICLNMKTGEHKILNYNRQEVMSSELIVTVDEFDNVIGTEEKEKCHEGEGILHRAFLAMVFDASGRLVLARRSEKKRLWPGFWDGTVASHLFRGEDYVGASKRRLSEEIGLEAPSVKYLFKFRYKVGYKDIGTEHEICAVTALHGVDAGKLQPESGEISEIRLIGPDELAKEMRLNGDAFAPWFILAVKRMNEDGLTE